MIAEFGASFQAALPARLRYNHAQQRAPGEALMPKYMVERHLPGFKAEQLPSAAALAKRTTGEMAKEGVPVRYLGSTFVPGEERCLCLFEGPSAEAVRQANVRAGLPLERIVEATNISPGDLE
jgi:hypothetical protein